MRKTIQEILKSYVDNGSGIFKIINTSHSLTFYNDGLDFEYVYSHSGDKYISPLLVKLLENNTISTENLTKVCNLIYNKYQDKWKKLYDAIIVTDYNPIENYNMEQTETPNITKTNHNETNTKIEVTGAGDSESGVYAFNSSDSVPNSSSQANTSQLTEGSKDYNFNDATETETGTRKLDRKGNIGVTTTQQMLEQEIELKKYNFYNQLYEDLDEILTLSVY